MCMICGANVTQRMKILSDGNRELHLQENHEQYAE
jgi:hypothetical protein